MIARAFLLVFIALAGLGSTGPAFAQGSDVQDVAEGDAPKTALFRVADEDTTIYIYPGANSLPVDARWFEGEVKTAFERSDELALEVNTEPSNAIFQDDQTTKLPEGTTLSDVLPDDALTKLNAELDRLGIPLSSIDQYRPWMIAFMVTAMSPQEVKSDHGVPTALAAKAGDKDRSYVETMEQQIGIMTNLSTENEVSYLTFTLNSLPNIDKEYRELVELWLAGDLVSLRERTVEEFGPVGLFEPMIADRAPVYADWIAKRMDEPGTVFLTVSAAMVAGENGILDLLAKRELAVERLQ